MHEAMRSYNCNHSVQLGSPDSYLKLRVITLCSLRSAFRIVFLTKNSEERETAPGLTKVSE